MFIRMMNVPFFVGPVFAGPLPRLLFSGGGHEMVAVPASDEPPGTEPRTADLLRQLPGVVQVEVAVRAEQPTHRIVHLRDWHFVPRDLYALDSNDEPYEQFLQKVDAVQQEQMTLLRCLIRDRGLRRVFAEGMTAEDLPHYKERIAVLRDMEQNQIPELRALLTRTKTAKHKAEIVDMLDQHKARLLELGAAGRLLIAGEIDGVLPLDDAEALDRAKPITPDGKFLMDDAKLAARHDAQVRAVLDAGPMAIIVLGGAHDLSDSVRRLGGGRCEYIRVTTRRFQEFTGD
jgi:hypothetical protein